MIDNFHLSWTYLPSYYILQIILEIILLLILVYLYYIKKLYKYSPYVILFFISLLVIWYIYFTPPTIDRMLIIPNHKLSIDEKVNLLQDLKYDSNNNKFYNFKSNNKNVVLGLAHGLPSETIKLFAGSLRGTKSKSDIVLFFHSPCDEIYTKYGDVAELYEIKLVCFTAPKNKLYHYSSIRFVLYENFLAASNNQYDYILLMDVRDAFFQRDPFEVNKLLGNDGIGITLETKKMGALLPNGLLGINGQWVTQCFGMFALGPIADQPVSCSGTTVGSKAGMKKYLHLMNQLQDNVYCFGHGNDQGVHNGILYLDQFKDYRPRIVNLGRFDSPYMTLSDWPKSELKFNDVGNFLTESGKIALIAHQYDRCEDQMIAPNSKYTCEWSKKIMKDSTTILTKEGFFA